MLKSCQYCGRIHERSYVCPKKPVRSKYNKTEKDRFRSTNAWAKKRTEIKQRDHFLCQICKRKLYNTYQQYNYENIEVHHIQKLESNYDLRLENTNLISLCSYHHRMADMGDIPTRELQDIVYEQERNYNGL